MIRQYIIEGEPVPKGRPKFTRTGHTYTPKKTREYEKYVRYQLMRQNPEMIPKGRAVYIHFCFVKPYLKSWSNKYLKSVKKLGLYAFKKPDLDNYIKSTLDACNGLLFEDDGQVVELNASKIYGEEPKTIIEIQEIDIWRSNNEQF